MARTPFLQHPAFPFWPWLTWGRLLLAAAWVTAVGFGIGRHVRSATEYDTDSRPPATLFRNPFTGQPIPSLGNYGHMEIDFGGQWLMGRMVARGYGRDLYDRNRQRQVLTESFPVEREPKERGLYKFPKEIRPEKYQGQDLSTDAEMLMAWTVGGAHDSPRWPELGVNVAAAFGGGTHPLAASAAELYSLDAAPENLAADLSKPSIGGPLYPPVHAMLYAPLGMIDDPRVAYYLFQILSTLSLFAAAFAVRYMTRGRIWTPIAANVLMLYPGFQPGLTLAQNHAVSLAVVMVGWALLCRNKPLAGGMVWGLLAFKPVWAVAFGLVPLLMWRPRFLVGMAAAGLVLCSATLPVVGPHGWENWMWNGGEATKVYNRCENWINLSRDLSGIVRRPMLDFKLPELERNLPAYGPGPVKKYSAADLVVWGAWAAFMGANAAVYYLWGRPRAPLGVAAGFVFLGAYVGCFRFMYYDSLLSFIGVAALFAYPWWFARRTGWDSDGTDPDRRARWASLPWAAFAVSTTVMTTLVRLRVSLFAEWTPFPERKWKLEKALAFDLETFGWLIAAVLVGLAWRYGRRALDPAADATGRRWTATVNSVPLTLLLVLLSLQSYFLALDPTFTAKLPVGETVREMKFSLNYEYATDTFVVLGMWLWAGWRMITGGDRPELHDAHAGG